MTIRLDLGHLRSDEGSPSAALAVRLILLVGWLVTAAGHLGPWIAHRTAALTLSGVDMAEFSKFIPDVLDGSIHVARQVFYLPAVAVAVGIALLVGSRELAYGWLLRVLALLLGFWLSLQLLPPAWSTASLVAKEFRIQVLILGVCWLLLLGFWVWCRLPQFATSTVTTGLAIVAAALVGWQFAVVKPAVDAVYHTTTSVGWGFVLCQVGLVIAAGASVSLAFVRTSRGRGNW